MGSMIRNFLIRIIRDRPLPFRIAGVPETVQKSRTLFGRCWGLSLLLRRAGEKVGGSCGVLAQSYKRTPGTV